MEFSLQTLYPGLIEHVKPLQQSASLVQVVRPSHKHVGSTTGGFVVSGVGGVVGSFVGCSVGSKDGSSDGCSVAIKA